VTRCRDILTKMQGGHGARAKAAPCAPIGASVRAAIAAWRSAHPEVRVDLAERGGADTRVALSTEDVEATVCTLLDNALHATRAARGAEVIEVEIAADAGAVLVRVEDRGTGVAPHLEGRLGEPFLTTKEPGEGMGLGLYLIRTLLAQAGGQLEVARRAPQGTRITLRLAQAGA
jgi:two-component system sensor histidine kinase RegB